MSPAQRSFGRTVLSKAAFHRKADARALLKAQRWRGAMYVGGYAIECKIKVQLMERYDCLNLAQLEDTIAARTGASPGLATVRGHHLEYLLGFTGRVESLRQDMEAYRCFLVCNQWDHRWRYAGDTGMAQEATRFLECVERFYVWLSHNV